VPLNNGVAGGDLSQTYFALAGQSPIFRFYPTNSKPLKQISVAKMPILRILFG